jgi:hypothetical protein
MQAREENRDRISRRAEELDGIKLRHLKCISKLSATPLICSGSGKMPGGRAAERVFSRMRTGKDLMGLECGCGERARGEYAKTVKHILYECPTLEEYRPDFKALAERKWREDVKEAAKRQPERVVVNPWGKTSILQRAPGETLSYIQECLRSGKLTAGSTRRSIMELVNRDGSVDIAKEGEEGGAKATGEGGSIALMGAMQLRITDGMVEEVFGDGEEAARAREEIKKLRVAGV